ncbi:MAG TPA: pitrilysin family protein [Chloroflexota bacterium]|nr:pitrilysin family protein [Chloroflexota bacterium]
MYDKTVLPNGLRILTAAMPHTRSVSINFFVGAGSRYELDEVAGISHFLEHMLFKGTERRPTPREIAETIEGVGGIMNAGTDRELTVYWCKVPSAHFARTLDVLADNLRHSLFAPEEIEKERAVIIEELHMVEDSPGDLVGVLIDEVLWPDQPLGRDIAGSDESVRGIRRQQMVDYLQQQYVPANTVLAVAGNVTHEQVVREAERLLSDWENRPFGAWFPAKDGQTEPRVAVKQKKTEQVHLCLGMPGLSAFHPDRYTLDVLNSILGEGMSSRLFLEVREKRGLAYDVHSYVSHYQDTGAAVVSAGVDPKKLGPTIEAVLEELDRLKDGIPEEEITKAREFIKGRLQLRMEDTRAVASWLGGQELLRKEILTVDDVVRIVDAVDAESLQRVARDVFRRDRMNLAVVGPQRGTARLEALLK